MVMVLLLGLVRVPVSFSWMSFWDLVTAAIVDALQEAIVEGDGHEVLWVSAHLAGDLDHGCCRRFCSVPGPLQSVQRAELWGVILALQTSRAVHLGVDNLGVVRHVGRLLGGCRGPKPFGLVNDGDLLLLIERMLHLRGLDTVRISKVKGHADDGMVLRGQVRREDWLGNDAADEAADFGRRRVSPAVIDARRNLSGVCGHWYFHS